MKLNPHTHARILTELKESYRTIAIQLLGHNPASSEKRKLDISSEISTLLTLAQKQARLVIPDGANERQSDTLAWFEHACSHSDTPEGMKAGMDIWHSYQRNLVMAEDTSKDAILGYIKLTFGN